MPIEMSVAELTEKFLRGELADREVNVLCAILEKQETHRVAFYELLDEEARECLRFFYAASQVLTEEYRKLYVDVLLHGAETPELKEFHEVQRLFHLGAWNLGEVALDLQDKINKKMKEVADKMAKTTN